MTAVCYDTLYPLPLIRGTRIARLEERPLGRFLLDAETAQHLGRENLGVFVGSCGTLPRLAESLRKLDAAASGGPWIVVAATKGMSDALQQLWSGAPTNVRADRQEKAPIWRTSRLLFCTPETARLVAAELRGTTAAGILLLDLSARVHRARGFSRGAFRIRNDRPQYVADLRASLAVDLWSPPLLIFAARPAKSVPTFAMLGPYCLDGLWYVDGRTLRCGIPPQPVPNALVLCTI